MLRLRLAGHVLTTSFIIIIILAGCSEPPEEPEAAAKESPLVGATLETGYLGVPALTSRFPGQGNLGSFCTGTLIAPQWVLTAAHCLIPGDEPVAARNTRIYFGNDVRSTSTGADPTGTFIQADAFVPHPQYKSTSNSYDIGLVHLSTAASGVTTYPYNTTSLPSSVIGTKAFYVGFGVDNGVAGTGSGVKRSGYMPIASLSPSKTLFTTQYQGTGICFGDSGGPSFLSIGGKATVIGVNSAVSNQSCNQAAVNTDVSTLASWVTQTMNAGAPSCKTHADSCFCSAGCQSNGTCNNAVCQTKSCLALWNCVAPCASTDYKCELDCYLTTTTAGQKAFDAMGACLTTHKCGSAANPSLCAAQYCQTTSDACYDMTAGSLSCEDIDDCVGKCGSTDNVCYRNCLGQGSSAGRKQYEAVVNCIDQYCGSVSGTAYDQCISKNCTSQLKACFSATCNILGGSCPSGKACYPTQSGSYACFDSQGKGLGQSCDPDAADLPCADGLVCIQQTLSSGICRKLCQDNSQCSGGQCKKPLFDGVSDVGYCTTSTVADAGPVKDAAPGKLDGGTAKKDRGVADGGKSRDGQQQSGADAGMGDDQGEGEPPEESGSSSGCEIGAGAGAPSGLVLLAVAGLIVLGRRRLWPRGL